MSGLSRVFADGRLNADLLVRNRAGVGALSKVTADLWSPLPDLYEYFGGRGGRLRWWGADTFAPFLIIITTHYGWLDRCDRASSWGYQDFGASLSVGVTQTGRLAIASPAGNSLNTAAILAPNGSSSATHGIFGICVKLSSAISTSSLFWYHGGNGTALPFQFRTETNGKVTFAVNGGSGALSSSFATSNASLCDDKWHYLLGVYANGTLSLYVDGVSQSTTSAGSGALNNTASNLTIATPSGGLSVAGAFFAADTNAFSAGDLAFANAYLRSETFNDYSLSATYASFVETSPTTTLAVAMPASQGSYTETGQAIVPSVGMPTAAGLFSGPSASAPTPFDVLGSRLKLEFSGEAGAYSGGIITDDRGNADVMGQDTPADRPTQTTTPGGKVAFAFGGTSTTYFSSAAGGHSTLTTLGLLPAIGTGQRLCAVAFKAPSSWASSSSFCALFSSGNQDLSLSGFGGQVFLETNLGGYASAIGNSNVCDNAWHRAMYIVDEANTITRFWVDGVLQTNTLPRVMGEPAEWGGFGDRWGNNFPAASFMAHLLFAYTASTFSGGDIAALDAALDAIITGAGGGSGTIGQDITFHVTRDIIAAQGSFAETGQAIVPSVGMPAAQGAYVETGESVGFGIVLPVGVGSTALTGEAATLTFTPGGGAFTLVAASGSFSETGQAAALAVAMPSAFGSFVETGEAAGLIAARILPVARGTFTESGQLVTLAVAMPAAQGSYTKSGQAAGLTTQRLLSVVRGLFAETGQPVAFPVAMPAAFGSFAETGQNVVLGVALPAAFGSYAEAGKAVSFLTTRLLAAAFGSFTRTGQPVGLGVALPAAFGSFVETGEPALLSSTRRIAAAFGAFVESGQAANLAVALGAAFGSFALVGEPVGFGVALPSARGLFTETGEAAGLLAARRLAVAFGSFVLSGKNAGLIYTPVGSSVLTADAGTFTRTGIAANLQATRRLVASSGSFSELGEPVGLQLNRRVVAAQGALSWLGIAAGLSSSRRLAVSPGVFNLAGQNVGLAAARRLTAGQGAFAETGEPTSLIVHRGVIATLGNFLLAGEAAQLSAVRFLHANPGAFAYLAFAADLIFGVAPPLNVPIIVGTEDEPTTEFRFVVLPSTLIRVEIAPTTRITIMADADIYDIGDVAEISATMRNSHTGALVDPGALTVKVKPPTSAEIDIVMPDSRIVRDSLGVFRCLVDVTEAGTWKYRFVASTPAKGEKPGTFRARAATF